MSTCPHSHQERGSCTEEDSHTCQSVAGDHCTGRGCHHRCWQVLPTPPAWAAQGISPLTVGTAAWFVILAVEPMPQLKQVTCLLQHHSRPCTIYINYKCIQADDMARLVLDKSVIVCFILK